MSTWLDQFQVYLAANYKILWGELVHCSTVDFLRLISFLLLGLVVTKILIQTIYLGILRMNGPIFPRKNHAKLYQIYETALADMGFKRTFKLRQYRKGPFLAFTVGIVSPSIFLSPRLIETMDEGEIRSLLIHELSHIKRHDNLRLWIWEFFGAGLPLLTVVFFGLYFVVSVRNSLYALCGTVLIIIVFFIFFKKAVGRRREKKCDDMTISITRDPITLASSLMKAWEMMKNRKTKLKEFLSPGHHILKGSSCLESRVRRLVYPKKKMVLQFLDHSAHYLFWTMLLLATLFLIRFHGLNAYENIGVKVILNDEGCQHIRAQKGNFCSTVGIIETREVLKE